jgi:hypothetical protein
MFGSNGSHPRRAIYAVAATALTLAFAAPAGAATHCGTAKVTEHGVLFTTVVSIPRCYNGKRIWATGPVKTSHALTLLGIDDRWNFNGVQNLSGPRRLTYRGHNFGELRIVRRFSFLQCLDLGPIGCVLPSGRKTQTTTLRAFYDGRIVGG